MPRHVPPAYLPAAVARYRLQNQAAAPKVETPFWSFRDAANGSTELMIYAEIGFSWWDDSGVTAAGFAKELANVKTPELVLRINSPGGDVFDGLAIGNLLAEHPAVKTVKVDALAASIASVIAVKAGTPTRTQPNNRIIMGRQAQMMIHDASGFAMGNAADMREMADLLDMISQNIAAAYADRAGGTATSWRTTMIGEKWYTDQAAVDAGLADEVSGDSKTMTCPGCDGTGKNGGKSCPDCAGEGTVPADVEDAACSTCDGTGKINRGTTKCPDCSGAGTTADDLAEAVRRAYAPAALLRPAALQRTEPPELPEVVEVVEPERVLAWTTGLADQLKTATRAATAPPTVDVDDWRETFATFRNNIPAVRDRVAPPVDLGPERVAPAPPVRNELADAIRAGIGVGRTNQPRPSDDPAPAGPVDLGAPPERPAPPPETPRNQLAELIGSAVVLAATDRPEPDGPDEPAPPTENPPFRLDVNALKRAVTEARF